MSRVVIIDLALVMAIFFVFYLWGVGIITNQNVFYGIICVLGCVLIISPVFKKKEKKSGIRPL